MAESGRHPVSQDQEVRPPILVIANDVILRTFLAAALHLEFERTIHTVSNGRSALEVVTRCKPDLLLLDDQLTDVNLLELSDQLHRHTERECIPTLLLDSHCDRWRKRQGYPIAFLRKPFMLDRLYTVVQQALAASHEWVESLSSL
jgi:DNA-binding NtrC family response regulator